MKALEAVNHACLGATDVAKEADPDSVAPSTQLEALPKDATVHDIMNALASEEE